MLRVAVMVSGGGTNLQAIIDAVESGRITNTELVAVISNNEGVYALERARKAGIRDIVVSPKNYDSREEFNKALIDTVDSLKVDLIVLAGFLVVIPPEMIDKYENRIINIHPIEVFHPVFFTLPQLADVAFVWRRPARMRGRSIKPHKSARRAPRRGANGCADVRF